MYNFLVLDTEKTYNVGYIVFNEKGIVEAKQMVVKENFEDRNICAINNYNRKKAIFDKQENVLYGNAGTICTQLNSVIKQYDIKTIFAHNASEDRIQIGTLLKQCAPYAPQRDFLADIPLADTVGLLKILYPENSDYSLETLVCDILGTDVKQRHTALDDCYWLVGILIPLCDVIDLYMKAPYVIDNLANDNAIRKVLPILINCKNYTVDKNIFEKMGKTDYTIKTLNTRLKNFVDGKLLDFKELDKIGKNGNVLKTKDNGYKLTSLGEECFKDAYTLISHNYTEEIKKCLIENVFNTLDNEIQTQVETFCNEKLKQKEQELENSFKQKEQELENTIKGFIEKCLNKKQIKAIQKMYSKGQITLDEVYNRLK